MSADTNEQKPNLEIETNEKTDADLDEIYREEGYNKSTAVNRAVQWYAECTRVLRGGGHIYLRQAGSDALEAIIMDSPER